jgi:serine/threonine-protein kinase
MMKGARYVVTGPLDRGLFRGVAVLRDGSQRDVAIMHALPNLTTNDRFVAMLVDELRSALQLHHENIVEVLDVARTPERAYYVITEYLEGCDLKALVARGARFAVQQAIHVIT